MPRIPIGLEMYSVRNEFAAAPLATMQAIKEMGYDGVEFAGDPRYCPEFYAALLKQTGLVCCGWHTGWHQVQPETLANTIKLNQAVGNRYIMIPGLIAEGHQGWKEMAHKMNALADQLAPFGMRTGYHNHAGDFAAIDGKTTWDTFMENTWRKVIMQLDTGNALAGGADVMQVLNTYPGRCETIHLKPYSTDPEKAYKPLIGDDDVPWQEVFQFCQEKGNTEWAIVEYECPEIPALEAVGQCLKALRKMGW